MAQKKKALKKKKKLSVSKNKKKEDDKVQTSHVQELYEDVAESWEQADLSEDKEFESEKTGKELERYIQDIAETVKLGLDQSISILTPWFFKNMPRIYYQTTPRQDKVRHLSAVITGHVFETKQTVELWDRDQSKVTFIGPGGQSKILLAMSEKISHLNIKMGSIYFSRDKLLFLSTFMLQEHKPADQKNERIVLKINEAKKMIEAEFPEQKQRIEHYIAHLDQDFVIWATRSRIKITYRMLQHMLNHEGAHTTVEPFQNSSSFRLVLGLKGIVISDNMESILHLVSRYEFEVERSFLVFFKEGYSFPISVVHFILKHHSGEPVSASHLGLLKLNKALRTLGWVDSDEYNQLSREPINYSINSSNFLRATACWIHIILGKDNPYYYSEHKIQTTFFEHEELSKGVIDLFRLRFDPLVVYEKRPKEYEALKGQLAIKIDEIIDKVERTIFREAINFIGCVLKTNYFIATKTGLAFRLDPKVLDPQFYPKIPFGIFFIIGRDYRFFQIRWKDVARGGLRVVMPKNETDYSIALSGLFDEVYGLSHAQQQKNKDIPEGGSKAVMVLAVGGNRDRAVKGGINALLDLLVSEDESKEEKASKQISYYPEQEIIYLGPDENMTNELITWIPEQAERRGYQFAKAFMSSKPGAGINHKEYGVTSEGVHVYVDYTLRFLGIDPNKKRFTVKMTGGPDGDVAGNELKILHREYGENARVVAIADGLGAAYDPDGLAWNELLRLVKESLSISFFKKEKLSKKSGSFVIKAEDKKTIKQRNELHFLSEADIFIPAGGRPYTVNDKNWQKFILPSGKASCLAIVEGANIFFTEEARENLQKEGVYIIKDSSANKTGVICSSFEIIASLLLSDSEFIAIKESYVAEVIETLKLKAAKEAKLLFSEYRKNRGNKNLVTLSKEISAEINQVTDTLLEDFTENKGKILDGALAQDIILRHCPNVLRKKYKKRILEQLPEAHKIAILSSYIASHIVYNEGLGWLNTVGAGEHYEAVMTYMDAYQHVGQLVEAVEKSHMKEKDKVLAVLKRSAARDLTVLSLETGLKSI